MKTSITNLQTTIPISATKIRCLARAAVASLSRSHALTLDELSLVFVDDTEIARINKQFVRHRGPTDVITFDYPNDKTRTAEIIISAQTAQTQAHHFRRPLTEELARYVIHGLLHLAGHNDATTKQKRAMRRAENELLAKRG